jgi:hypothetical protein
LLGEEALGAKKYNNAGVEMTHHVDRFFAAVSILVAHGPIKQRLIRAYEDNLVSIEEDELPASIQKDFAKLRRAMHCVAPANGEGPICASVRKMSKVQADDCAELIVQMYGKVVQLQDEMGSPMPLSGDDHANVPPFLVKSR